MNIHPSYYVVAVSLACACGSTSRGPVATEGLTGGSDGTSSTGSSTGGWQNSAGPGSSSGGSGSGTGVGSTGGGDGSSAGTGTAGPGTTSGGNPGGKPNGEPCAADSECMSDNCYLVPMAGFCAECNEDADCPGGGCQADPLAPDAWCTDGALGTMCQTDAACGGALVCAELFDAKGFADASYCSDCAVDGDCAGGELCAPTYAEGGLSGYRTCVAPGSVPNDQGCSVDGNGQGRDAACASGICNVVDVAGLGILVGVCGECETAADCGGGQCVAASASLMSGVKGGVCS